MEYDELVALGSIDDVQRELGNHVQEYYDKFLGEGHIYDNMLSDEGTSARYRGQCNVMYMHTLWMQYCGSQ